MYFSMKNTLKNNHNYTPKQAWQHCSMAYNSNQTGHIHLCMFCNCHFQHITLTKRKRWHKPYKKKIVRKGKKS